MLANLSLRLRVFLFFCLIALGGALILGASLWAGLSRALTTTPQNGFVLAGILSIFGLTALTAGVWLLFDENVAKPIERLSAGMRARAHAGVAVEVDARAARYLGDLGPAASAVTEALAQNAMSTAQRVAAETERLAQERERLTALLTEIPVAMMLINSAGQIVLYDGQAAEVLSTLGMPRLNAPLTDYFDAGSLDRARGRVNRSGKEARCVLTSRDGAQSFDARMKPMDAGGYLLIVDAAHTDIPPDAARPLVYDFALLTARPGEIGDETPLCDLTYTVFDTETTGLLPHKDEIVQLGALRVLGGRIVPGETIDQLVDPGRPIPPSATRVHHVTDAMVAGKPDIAEAGRRFHSFAQGSVIVAHNAPFDMAFLRRHRARMGVEWHNPVLDTVLLSAVLFGASETHTLDALCQRLGVTIPERLRHTAMGDAQATAEVLIHMLPMLQARGLTTLGAVLAETRRHGRLLEDLN
ncbi:3'-5' exonuclease [Ponticoccus alexandrii]|uniref:DNA-directed DNA polymerase n=1 Tax=Ponticoccus alexandrii TaxID=1943633 RepID=A0ABX7F6D9_9RHOB|nr:3'-5' exonuclease [Ponticoccus alexandrii]ETA49810.1 3'-5' exonuclease [Rhodobacteraceae bacterium PD-2]QRF66096.1 3'-5' exonuclease [Ponticoccus alexandrii]